jgi:hypothetical protein
MKSALTLFAGLVIAQAQARYGNSTNTTSSDSSDSESEHHKSAGSWGRTYGNATNETQWSVNGEAFCTLDKVTTASCNNIMTRISMTYMGGNSTVNCTSTEALAQADSACPEGMNLTIEEHSMSNQTVSSAMGFSTVK